MANSWLRLWHDMPNDPKWRTIARKSKRGSAMLSLCTCTFLLTHQVPVKRLVTQV